MECTGSGTHTTGGSKCTMTTIRKPCKCTDQLTTATEKLPAGSTVKGAISLGFVIDITISMSDDIHAVKAGAQALIKENDKYKVFSDYVIVPFNDPDVGPAHVTSSGAKALKHINNLPKTLAGGDCPEKTLVALKMALSKTRPGSVIFVFTDASSKDENLLEKVKGIVAAKKITVNFVITKNPCGRGRHYNVYQQIANVNKGKFLAVHNEEVKEVMAFMSTALRAGRAGIYSMPSHISEIRTITDKFQKCTCPKPEVKEVCKNGSKTTKTWKKQGFKLEKGEIDLTRQRAGQDSTYNEHSGAHNAVDGNLDPNANHGSTQCTKGGPWTYWWVYLGANYYVDHVLVYSRQDCCAERIQNTAVTIGVPERGRRKSYLTKGYKMCGMITGIKKVYNIGCNHQSAKFLMLIRKTGFLNVAEVRVFGSKTKPTGTGSGTHTTGGSECTMTTIRKPCECTEKGAISLGIVMDTTGSMAEYLPTLKASIQALLIENDKYKVFREYVIVPFHDPNVGPAHVTSSVPKALEYIENWPILFGSGDCPEKSLAALKMALSKTRPGSVIIVFTDSTSKDEDLLEEVKSIVAAKKITVNFIVTKNPCGKGFYEAYLQIAEISNGKFLIAIANDQVKSYIAWMSTKIHAGRAAIKSMPKHG